MNAIWFYAVPYAALLVNFGALVRNSPFRFGIAWGLVIAWVAALVLEAVT